jgi:hypothetical protein
MNPGGKPNRQNSSWWAATTERKDWLASAPRKAAAKQAPGTKGQSAAVNSKQKKAG